MKLLSLTQFAARVHRSRQAVYNWTVKGDLKVFTNKPYILIDAAMLRAFKLPKRGRPVKTKGPHESRKGKGGKK